MEEINDDVVIDESSGEAVTPKHAILIDCINDFTDDQYCEAVGSIIGSNNIRFLNRENGKMKIYLNYLSLVNRVVQSGIWIGGVFQDANYNDLDSTKLLLSNVQYEIPNNLLKEKLSLIGEVTSDIITMKAEVSNPAYAHVLSATRSVHVKIDPGMTIPHSFEVIFGGRQYEIFIQCDVMLISSDATEQDLPLIYPGRKPSKKYAEQKFCAMNQKEGDGLAPALPRKRGRPARQGQHGKVARKNLKLGKSLATRKKRRYKKVNLVSKRMRKDGSVKKRISGKKHTLMTTATTFSFSYDQVKENTDDNYQESSFANKEDLAGEDDCGVPFKLSESFNVVDGNIRDSLDNDDDTLEMDLCNAVEDTVADSIMESSDSAMPQYPLSLLSLRRFLKDAKNNRNPFEVAMKVLEECNTPGAVNLLCNQLIEYYHCVHERSLQNRICRLVNILSGGEKDI